MNNKDKLFTTEMQSYEIELVRLIQQISLFLVSRNLPKNQVTWSIIGFHFISMVQIERLNLIQPELLFFVVRLTNILQYSLHHPLLLISKDLKSRLFVSCFALLCSTSQ